MRHLKMRLYVRARHLKHETYALYLAYRDPRTPWYARVFALIVVAYAISPIDLIPDFIPVLGYLDDLILIPAGIVLVLKLIPPEVMQDARRQSASVLAKNHPAGRIAAAVTVAIWVILVMVIAAMIR